MTGIYLCNKDKKIKNKRIYTLTEWRSFENIVDKLGQFAHKPVVVKWEKNFLLIHHESGENDDYEPGYLKYIRR